MKRIFLLLTVLFQLPAFAQTGGVVIECLDYMKLTPLDSIAVEAHQDSACCLVYTDMDGRALLRNLPVGTNEIWIYPRDKDTVLKANFIVQENQLLQTTVRVDTRNKPQLVNQSFSSRYEDSKDGLQSAPMQYVEGITVSAASYDLQEVQVAAAYKRVSLVPGVVRQTRAKRSQRKWEREERKMQREQAAQPVTEQPVVEAPVEPVIPKEEPLYFDADRFLPVYENDFLSTVGQPNSTFGLDVDQASWTYVRERLQNKQWVQRDAVKLEEMINAFHYKPVEVPEKEDFGVDLRRQSCPWNTEHQLVSIHLKAKDLPKDTPRKKHNLVLLIDVSGSMSDRNKLPLLIEGMKDFVKSLDEQDRVSIVTYAGRSGVALPPTSCDQKEVIIQALNGLSSGGSTNGIGGITEAYRLAEENFDAEKNNRIILATDGDFNVGISAEGDLENYIAQKRGKGIYLTALGFGMGNYKNSVLETLADRGDGNHFYINNRAECRKVLIDGVGNILNLARDVKLNVEFNPEYVKEYRLIGYENRLLRPQDFEDDTKDAGEIGYGHEVTAVYEIVPGEGEKEKNHFVTAKPQHNRKELAYVKLRYKPLEAQSSIERQYTLLNDAAISDDAKLQSVIALGLYLRNSVFKGQLDVQLLQDMGRKLSTSDKEEADLKNILLGIPL